MWRIVGFVDGLVFVFVIWIKSKVHHKVDCVVSLGSCLKTRCSLLLFESLTLTSAVRNLEKCRLILNITNYVVKHCHVSTHLLYLLRHTTSLSLCFIKHCFINYHFQTLFYKLSFYVIQSTWLHTFDNLHL